MPELKFEITKRMFNPHFYPLLKDYRHRWEIYRGGAGSGKSHHITQKLILKSLESKRTIMVCRKYGSTLRNSTWALFKEVLGQFKMLEYCKILDSSFRIEMPNGSVIFMIGLDDEEKLLSLANVTDIWVEETSEVERDIVFQLDLRLRSLAPSLQIFLSFNPISNKSWLYDFCEINPPKNCLIDLSTYKDNKFLPQSYIDSLEDMARTNPKKYRVFALNEWGADVDGLVYTNWEKKDFDIRKLLDRGCEHLVGMDLGWTDPTTIVDTLYDRPQRTIYIIQEYYQRGATLDEIVQALRDMHLTKSIIRADSADPRAISYFRSEGMRVYAAKKGAGSVNTGIAFLQNHKIYVLPTLKHTISSLENFVYLKDKDGFLTDKTDHEFSHIPDALRYAYSDIYKSGKVKTLNKTKFGIWG